jgi:hypothetical protein
MANNTKGHEGAKAPPAQAVFDCSIFGVPNPYRSAESSHFVPLKLEKRTQT